MVLNWLDTVGLGLVVTVGVTVMDTLGVTLIDGVAGGVTEKEGFGETLIDTEGVTLNGGTEVLTLGVILGVAVALIVTLGVLLGLTDIVGVIVTLGVELGVILGVTEGDPGIRLLVTTLGLHVSSLTNFILEAENGMSTIIPDTRSLTSTFDATKLVSS